MGRETFSMHSYSTAKSVLGVTSDVGVTRTAEHKAQVYGHLNEIVDPAINPVRFSKIRLDPHQGKWIVTVGCPMDIEVSCDTTGSMGGEVDTEMAVLPDLYSAVAQAMPGYDPQLCLGIFGDVTDRFTLCRPQFEMEAMKIVNYLKEMAPQRAGGDFPEDPQYAMFARAYLTDAYTNRIGLKGYHFIVTDATCHTSISRYQIERIFGTNIFENELKEMIEVPTIEQVVKMLQSKAHAYVLLVDASNETREFWEELVGDNRVIDIDSTRQLPEVISTIIGLTEGTIDIADIDKHLGTVSNATVGQLSRIDIGAQVALRHNMEHPVPKAGDIFADKSDLWPTDETDDSGNESAVVSSDEIEYV